MKATAVGLDSDLVLGKCHVNLVTAHRRKSCTNRLAAARTPAARSSRAARPWIATASSRRQAPTGSPLMAASLASGRLASARSASSCSPAGVAANVNAVHLRRKNRTRRSSHGITTNKIGGAATASASTHASHDAVVSRLCPAPAMSSAASLAARNGLPSASPTSGTSSVLSPAEPRLSATPLAPVSSWRPTSAMVDTAACTAIPTSTHTVVQAITTRSLISCATSRVGVVA